MAGIFKIGLTIVGLLAGIIFVPYCVTDSVAAAPEGYRLAVTVADGAALGPELVTTEGWTITNLSKLSYANGVATFTNSDSGNFLYKDIGLEIGKSYQVSFDITSLSSGNVRSFVGGALPYSPLRGTVDTYKETLAPVAGDNSTLAFVSYLPLTATVENISCREIIPTWVDFTWESPWQHSVAIGDSITADKDNSFVAQLNHTVGHMKMTNAGVPADTLAMMDLRFATDVAALKPEVVVIMGGINDIGPAVSSPLVKMKARFESIIAKTLAIPAKPVVLGLTPFGSATNPWRWTAERQGWHDEYRAYLKDYALKNGYSFIDVFTPLLDTDGVSMKAGYTDYFLHPNYNGHKIIAERIAAIATDYSKTLPPVPPKSY